MVHSLQFADEEKLVQWNEQGTDPKDLGRFNITSATDMTDIKGKIYLSGPHFTH